MLEQIFVCIDDCEVGKAPISALVFMFLLSVSGFGFSLKMKDIYFYFFSSQLLLKVLSASKPGNKLVPNHAVETLCI